MIFNGFICRCLFWAPVFFLTSFINVEARVKAADIETYINKLEYLSGDFIQMNADGCTYTGHMYMSKAKGKDVGVRIDYEAGLQQRIFIKNDTITIVDLVTKKKTVNSISQTPIYSILSHGFDLSKEDYVMDAGDDKYCYCSIYQTTIYGKTCIRLIFSKYPTGNLKNLEGWIIEEPGGEIVFNFLPGNMSVNDKSKVPLGIFYDH